MKFRQRVLIWIEEYLFFPNWIQRVLSFVLLPLSLIYLTLIVVKQFFSQPKSYGIKVISVGNLTLGGNGKTPFIISLVKSFHEKKIAIILRGYGRQSQGLYVANEERNVKIIGDEASVYISKLPESLVIVSEDRVEGILKAKELGAELVILDDGFGKFDIAKFDILLESKNQPTNSFVLPSGGYRYPRFFKKYADLTLCEDVDFKRVVSIDEVGKEFVLITAISKPTRLDEFLPLSVQEKYYFKDHHNFTKDEIDSIMSLHENQQILTTTKDEVKLSQFGYPLTIINLDIEINKEKIAIIKAYEKLEG